MPFLAVSVNLFALLTITGETEEAILTADDEGVDALNLTARQYLIVGQNSRFEDYDEDYNNAIILKDEYLATIIKVEQYYGKQLLYLNIDKNNKNFYNIP